MLYPGVYHLKLLFLVQNNPGYIKPLMKSLLKQRKLRNRLRRRGQPDKADAVAQKINTLISNDRAHRLSKLNTATATTKELLAAVNKVSNARQDDGLAILHNPD